MRTVLIGMGAGAIIFVMVNRFGNRSVRIEMVIGKHPTGVVGHEKHGLIFVDIHMTGGLSQTRLLVDQFQAVVRLDSVCENSPSLIWGFTDRIHKPAIGRDDLEGGVFYLSQERIKSQATSFHIPADQVYPF